MIKKKSKFTDEQVREIAHRLEAGEPVADIASSLGCDRQTLERRLLWAGFEIEFVVIRTRRLRPIRVEAELAAEIEGDDDGE